MLCRFLSLRSKAALYSATPWSQFPDLRIWASRKVRCRFLRTSALERGKAQSDCGVGGAGSALLICRGLVGGGVHGCG